METTKLRRFAQYARRALLELVEARLQLVLQPGSAARRENAEAIKKLEEAIRDQGEVQIVERVAYIWFNRFCALRFMDVNRYTRIGIVSPAEGQFQPEILAEAKMGHIDEEIVPEKVRERVSSLLADKTPSRDPQGEAYRLLVVAACNDFHRVMPFLFERIDDYTELLMPDDLLSGNSILAYTREAMTPDACADVEVIGWLYQFYISEKKDAVFEGLKKNQKITPDNIPAATQLFTPHWIVRYLVENSLGRLWMLNRPGSRLVEQMDYYVAPEQAETGFLEIAKPEDIKICDPACGSGHMLTYAFDLLYAIYEEEGVDAVEIPEKILTHNLYGIEIDERAGELAAFALTMKARAKQRRFFNKGVKPNICVLENVKFDEGELTSYVDFVGRDLFSAALQTTLLQFEEANNFGSLIRPDATDVDGMVGMLESKDVTEHLFFSMTHQKVLQALRHIDYLGPKYHVVIANPPYMGGKGMNGRLAAWAKDYYPDSKSDLMTCFMERAQALVRDKGLWGMINLPSWMFLSSFEKLRLKLLKESEVKSLLHLGRGIFGADFGSVAFVVGNRKPGSETTGIYRRLFEKSSLVRDPEEIRQLFLKSDYGRFNVPQVGFLKIPGQPIAYWLSNKVFDAFEQLPPLSSVAPTKQGLATGDNDSFLRLWQELSYSRIAFDNESSEETKTRREKWYPCNKGGEFRKWYGNNSIVVNWANAGQEIKNFFGDNGRLRSRPQNESFYFRQGLTWSAISIASLSMRLSPRGAMFETKGAMCFPKQHDMYSVLAFANTKIVNRLLLALSPTLDFHEGPVGRLPYCHAEGAGGIGTRCAEIAKWDWDSSEISWEFSGSPLVNSQFRQPTLRASYQKLRAHWRELTLEMQQLEEENNRIFIEAYGLQDELTADVPIDEITLTCNPHYRYGGQKSEEELEALLLGDTMRELISYAVGCMFGRYALDKPGLILANQGETNDDYLKKVPESRFTADDDNVIPMLDGDWFTDDVAERFRKFLRVAFGNVNFEENLKFIELALGKNGKARDIRDYLLKDFYPDHIKRYKKRPIYWLFSSPKGSFNALIYVHRYRPDTVSVVLNGYLRDFRNKLAAHLSYLQQVGVSAMANQTEKTRANKDIESVKKQLQELDDYERDTLYPLATEQLVLDLDDGVKRNYVKFGTALKKIVGIDAKEED
ncbi:BREX-1 system adenine-specific DNA-methyltransferase PglX [Paraburkholderia terrae]